MHRIALSCSLACSLACSVTAPLAAFQGNGKIPITTRSDEARALFVRARALNETLTAHEAHVLFVRTIALDPSFAMAEYYLASTAPTARERAEHLQKAVVLAANVSPGERLVILGLEARNHADRARSLTLAESLVVLYPRDERVHSGLAILYGGQQRYAKAIVEYQKAIDINPEYSLAYNQLGYANRSVGNMAAAEAAFRQYIAHMPNDPNPYDSYAELLMKTGRFDESIVQYRKALSHDPHFGASYIGIAANEMFAGRHSAALAELDAYYAAARDASERRAALFNRAMIDVDRGMPDMALQAMERSYALAGASGDTVSMAADGIATADILLEAKRVDAAHDRYRQAHDLVAGSTLSAEVRADDALARHYDLARVGLAQHDPKTAIAEATTYMIGATARKNDVRVRQAHELNGLVALHDLKFSESLAELSQADQENPAVVYAMASAYAGKGDTAKAKELSERAVHMNILPTLPYVFTRAAVAASNRSATSGTAPGKPR